MMESGKTKYNALDTHLLVCFFVFIFCLFVCFFFVILRLIFFLLLLLLLFLEVNTCGTSWSDTLGPFKHFVMNKKVFRNSFCNPQKSFHTSLTRIIEVVNHSSNSTIALKKNTPTRNFFSSKCYCWVWRMVDSLYYSSRKIPKRCENSFVDYRINYQKLCYFVICLNQAFGNLFCNPQKGFHTSLESSDSNNRGCQPFFKLKNSIY